MGGVQKVFLEPGLGAGQPLLDGFEFRLALRIKGHAGEAEVAQHVGYDLALGRVQALVFRPLGDPAAGGEQFRVLAHLRGVVGELGQAGVIGLAQGAAVRHGVQVLDGGPEAVKAIVHFLQGGNEIVPGVFGVLRQQFLQATAVVRQQHVQFRLYGLGTEAAESGQVLADADFFRGIHG